MSTLNPTQDSRTSYDETTGAVRSFFGAEIVEPLPVAKRGLNVTEKVDDFLDVNRDVFKLENISLEKTDISEGVASESVRYEQRHQGIPVYRSQLVIGLRKRDGAVTSAVNSIDYDIPDSITSDTVRLTGDQVVAAVRQRFAERFARLKIETPKLYIYRYLPDDSVELDLPLPRIRQEMLGLSTGILGQVYLVWQVLMETEEPDGSWELLVDATSGELVAAKDRYRYATPRGNIFCPDPIRSKQDDSLSWSTPESDLNKQLVEVTLENLDAPVNGKYKLDGKKVRTRDREKPDNTLPESTSDFKYGAKSKEFLNVMAYYYLDRLITDLHSYGIPAFNNATKEPIEVDAQGFKGLNNSHFVASTPPFIGFGTDTDEPDGPHVPDAQDPGVIVHEYGHAIHHFLKKNQSYAHEHWFCDFLAVAWVDRYNKYQYLRNEMFPWDNNSGNEWSDIRRIDLTQRFDDAGYSNYGATLQGAIGATALWDLFLNIGGNSSNADVRKWAADEVILTYMEMLSTVVTAYATKEELAKGLIQADINRTGGIYRKVIWDAFRRRGMWKEFTPMGNIDPYIRDSSGDTGEHSSPEVHWASPDIWVRNNPPPVNPNDPNDPNYGENPEDGHQPPINDIPNYTYVRVHNRGSQAIPANTFSVEAFHCSPATAMLYPDHFQSMGKLTITEPIPANGGSVRVGPFVWTPQIKDHECLFAIIDGTSDPAIAKQIKGSIDHWKLVRYDNNVGQVNVTPQSSVPGGKTKTSFLVRGTVYPSLNQLTIDASTLPADTHIQVHLARRLTDQATGLSGFILSSQNTRWSTLTLPGGQVGTINNFPLEAHDQASVTLMVDFSYQAEHLHRYPIVVTQVQEGQIAGRLTIELTAVKETEDLVFGNPVSMELHTIHCPLWHRIAQHHKIPFMAVKDGLVRGYNGCAFCLSDYNTG